LLLLLEFTLTSTLAPTRTSTSSRSLWWDRYAPHLVHIDAIDSEQEADHLEVTHLGSEHERRIMGATGQVHISATGRQ